MSRFRFCNCPAGFSADPERHAPDCPGRSGAGKARTPAPATLTASHPVDSSVDFGIDGRSVRVSQEAYSIFLAREAAGREKIAALQQRLTAADERADRLETGLKWESDRNALLLASLTEAEDMLSVTSLEAGQRIEVLEGLLREWIGPGVRSVSHMLSLQTRTNAALKPAEGGSDEAMSFAQIAQFNDDNDHCPEREE